MERDQIKDDWVLPKRVQKSVVVSRRDGSTMTASLNDISCDGCQLRTEERLEPGEHVILVHSDVGELRGEVRWNAQGKVGIRFESALARSEDR
jgi:hypothetical protein